MKANSEKAVREASKSRKTGETDIQLKLTLDGQGRGQIDTGIGFFDHMLTLFCAHGFMDLSLTARGDLEVDAHHTVEDVGIVLGDAIDEALGDRHGIRRYGHAVTPMDETLAAVSIDLSRRPYLVYNVPAGGRAGGAFDFALAKEFFQALSVHAGMNLHINLQYGENEHHILEAIFKATGRALDQAAAKDERISATLSTKGTL